VAPGDQVGGSENSFVWALSWLRPPESTSRNATVLWWRGLSTAIQYLVPAVTLADGTVAVFQVPGTVGEMNPSASSVPGLLLALVV
jgi:hypothetical protein